MNRWVNLDELMALFDTCSDEDINARRNIEDAISAGHIKTAEMPETLTQSEMWDKMIPPPDEQIIINSLGAVCMSYAALKQLGYEYNGEEREKLEQWLSGKCGENE